MIGIFRLSHRLKRDERVTTHLALTARAFGASFFVYSGKRDLNFEQSINKVVKNWGGSFNVNYVNDAKKSLNEFKSKGFSLWHLTMYGMPIKDVVDSYKKLDNPDIMLIVGGKKVRSWVYDIADYNISITNQPISEISALAIALYLLNNGKFLYKNFEDHLFRNASIKIDPTPRGKKVIKS